MSASQVTQLYKSEIPDIYLQPISTNDVSQTYVDWLNDSDINQYLETRHTKQTQKTVFSFICTILENPNEHLFTIRLSKNHNHIGNIKVGNINNTHKTAEVSLFIGDKSVWGKGYASQAIKLISQYAFDTLQLRKLCAGAYQPNIASTKAFLKAGYQHDGVLARHYVLDGVAYDRVQVCLFNNNE